MSVHTNILNTATPAFEMNDGSNPPAFAHRSFSVGGLRILRTSYAKQASAQTNALSVNFSQSNIQNLILN